VIVGGSCATPPVEERTRVKGHAESDNRSTSSDQPAIAFNVRPRSPRTIGSATF
jgi:hypothetical protein